MRILKQIKPRLTRGAGQPTAADRTTLRRQLDHQLEVELARLVAMPTTSTGNNTAGSIISLRQRTGSEASVAGIAYVAAEMRKAGMFVTDVEQGTYHSVVATSYRTKRPRIMLQAHIDVIPVDDEALLDLRKSHDRYVGRGVYDMKFAIACYLQFIRTHRKILDGLDFGIMITSDEEVGGFNGAKILADEGWGGDIMLNPDGGNDWKVESHAKGIWMADIVATGVPAHGSRPWEGDSALNHLIPALDDIMQLFDNNDKMRATCNIGKLAAGESFNQVAASGHAVLDIRSFSRQEIARLDKQMRGIADKFDVRYTLEELGPPVTIDPESELVHSFAKHVESVTGEPCEFIHSYGATDSRWFDDPSIQNIVVRPHGGGSHGNDEWLLIEDLSKFYLLIESFVLDSAIK